MGGRTIASTGTRYRRRCRSPRWDVDGIIIVLAIIRDPPRWLGHLREALATGPCNPVPRTNMDGIPIGLVVGAHKELLLLPISGLLGRALFRRLRASGSSFPRCRWQRYLSGDAGILVHVRVRLERNGIVHTQSGGIADRQVVQVQGSDVYVFGPDRARLIVMLRLDLLILIVVTGVVSIRWRLIPCRPIRPLLYPLIPIIREPGQRISVQLSLVQHHSTVPGWHALVESEMQGIDEYTYREPLATNMNVPAGHIDIHLVGPRDDPSRRHLHILLGEPFAVRGRESL